MLNLGAKFLAEKKALGQAAVNASEAFSLLQTADAALNKISDKLDDLLRVMRIQHDRAVDPQLRDVLREIELRASVELAKLRRLG